MGSLIMYSAILSLACLAILTEGKHSNYTEVDVTEDCTDGFVTIYKIPCQSDCAHYGESYYWCRLANGDWDYCSLDYRHTRYGELCGWGSGCDQRSYSYYWCDLYQGGWDYCSPRCQPQTNRT